MRKFQVTRVAIIEITDAEYGLIHNLYDHKVKAIKFVREQHSLGLKEAKDICDAIWSGNTGVSE